MSEEHIEKIRFLDAGGQEMFSICNGSSALGTINISSGPADSSMVAEGAGIVSGNP